MPTIAPPRSFPQPDALVSFVRKADRLLVLTGAGCSTESGIPDYRDAQGEWKRDQPVYLQDFVNSFEARQRYWAGSFLGWRAIALAQPNIAHNALARLEEKAYVHHVITQNVDGLHQKAGSRKIIDLHGRLDHVECLSCGDSISREHLQIVLEDLNRGWSAARAMPAPDGDADLEGADYASFRVAPCSRCSGMLKPGVVFFGETVPRSRVSDAMARLEEADALLVVGSSLMVFSGYRFVRKAAERRLPVAAVNMGRTRADDLINLKIEQPCSMVLGDLLQRLGL